MIYFRQQLIILSSHPAEIAPRPITSPVKWSGCPAKAHKLQLITQLKWSENFVLPTSPPYFRESVSFSISAPDLTLPSSPAVPSGQPVAPCLHVKTGDLICWERHGRGTPVTAQSQVCDTRFSISNVIPKYRTVVPINTVLCEWPTIWERDQANTSLSALLSPLAVSVVLSASLT